MERIVEERDKQNLAAVDSANFYYYKNDENSVEINVFQFNGVDDVFSLLTVYLIGHKSRMF